MCLSPKKRGPGVPERCWGQVGPDLGEGAARRLTQEQEKVEGTQGQADLGEILETISQPQAGGW